MRQLMSAMQLNLGKLFRLGEEAELTTRSNGQVLTMERLDVMRTLFNNGKIEILFAGRDLTEEDNGKTFILTSPAGFQLNLPAVTGGKSWAFDFVVGAPPTSGNYDIVTANSGNTLYGGASNSAGAAGTFAAEADTARFVSGSAAVGDRFSLHSSFFLLEQWYLSGHSAVAAGLTTIQAT